jgi:hypothetical protein
LTLSKERGFKVPFDINTAIPMTETEGTLQRKVPFDINTAQSVNDLELEQREKYAMEHPFETTAKLGLGLLSETAKIIRWPFRRFIEHPVSTIITSLQEPKGKTITGVAKEVGKAFIPKPMETVNTYSDIWNNYYKAITGTDAPDWYLFMASYGTAMGVEPPIIKGVERGVELVATRIATAEEAQIIRNAFNPIKTTLAQRGIDTKNLYPEGNIVRLSEKSELYINNRLSAILRGDEIRIPRWWKITPSKIPTIAEISTQKGLTPIVSETLPVTTPDLIPTPPPIEVISPVQKVISALKEAKSVRGEQETLYRKARAEKFAKMQAVGEKVKGEKGYYAELGALKGALPKVEFEAIRNKLTQEDIDSLFNMVKDTSAIGEWEKLAAREGLAKIFGEMGGKVPTENEIGLLNKVFGEEFTKAILEKRTLFAKMKDVGTQIANIPRSLMASFDLSAPMRQGIFLIGKPKQFFPAFQRMFGAFKNEKAFKIIQNSITTHPDYEFAKESGLALTEMNVLLKEREEAFMGNWAEKIPLVGRGVRASGRAYVGFLNKLRFDVFKDLVNKAEGMGLNPKENRDLLKAIADFVNNATGRGTLPLGLQKAAVTLNNLFFSPRLLWSRINLLNPFYYMKQTPFVRREALKSLFSFIGFAITILTLAKMAGAEVGIDPRSSDFGKIKIGNTRIDVWGGFQQFARVAGQLISGKYISSTTGKEMTLGEGYRPLTRADIIQHFIEGKEAPVPSFVTELMKGKDITGENINVPKEIALRFIPMVIQDMFDIAQESPGLLPMSLLGIFGVGIQTYKEKRYW